MRDFLFTFFPVSPKQYIKEPNRTIFLNTILKHDPGQTIDAYQLVGAVYLSIFGYSDPVYSIRNSHVSHQEDTIRHEIVVIRTAIIRYTVSSLLICVQMF